MGWMGMTEDETKAQLARAIERLSSFENSEDHVIARELIEWCRDNNIHLTALDVGEIKFGFAVPPGQPLVPQAPGQLAADDDEQTGPVSYLDEYAQHDPPPEFGGGDDE